MADIIHVFAREIRDSLGNPTVEAEDIVASVEAEAEAEGKELPENAAAPTYADAPTTKVPMTAARIQPTAQNA